MKRASAEGRTRPARTGRVFWRSHAFAGAMPVLRAALRPRTSTLTAATPHSKARSGSVPSTKLPVHSFVTPTTFTITAPPIRLAIGLIQAKPAPIVLADSQLEESSQNGPLNA